MKTIISVIAFAILAVIFLEISQINAHRGGNRRCPEKDRPPINTTEITCRTFPQGPAPIIRAMACARKCNNCYNRTELARPASCFVKNKCQCLAKTSNSTSPPTTESPQDPSTTQSAQDPSTTQSAQDPSTTQSAQDPSTTQSAQDPSTTQSAEDPSTTQSAQDPSTTQSAEDPTTVAP